MCDLPKKAAVLAVFLSGVFSLTSSAAQKEVPGYLRSDVFFGVHGLRVVPSVTKDPRYPNSPTQTAFVRFFEYPPGADDGSPPPGNVYKDYGARVWGLLTPKETAEYVFFIASMGPSQLWLSTDGTEGNKKLIASEAEWNPRRDWLTVDRRPGCPDACSNKSAPVRLEANKKYFVEVISRDGRFGDGVAVTRVCRLHSR